MSENQLWLALAIGNSRWHWALFDGEIIKQTWDSDRPIENGNELSQFPKTDRPLPLILASVVPQQTTLWQNYPDLRIITLEKLPLTGLYPTLGIDRALAVLGAGSVLGWPVLAIDAGTALTFTGADLRRRLVGGAILPGLMLASMFILYVTVRCYIKPSLGPPIPVEERLPLRRKLRSPAFANLRG